RNGPGRQRGVVNGHFIYSPGVIIRPAVPGGANGPITVDYGQRAGHRRRAGDLRAVAVELPACTIVGADQVDPVGAAKITTRDGETRGVGIAANLYIVGVNDRSRTHHIVRSTAIDSQEDLRAVGH